MHARADFPSLEEISKFTTEQCQTALQAIFRTCDLELEEIWPDLDAITNSILHLEDRIRHIEVLNTAHLANQARWPQDRTPTRSQQAAEPKIKPGKPARAYRIGTEIYANIKAAHLATGISLHTLKSYVSRYPETYSYVNP